MASSGVVFFSADAHGKKTEFVHHFYVVKLMTILPRQARDKTNTGKALKKRTSF